MCALISVCCAAMHQLAVTGAEGTLSVFLLPHSTPAVNHFRPSFAAVLSFWLSRVLFKRSVYVFLFL